MKLKFIAQRDQMDCGPACIAMISNYYGKRYSLSNLRNKAHITRAGVSIAGIKMACEEIGLETISVKLSLEELVEKQSYFPCILYWEQRHFLILKGIKKRWWGKKPIFDVIDPAHGGIKIAEQNFKSSWINHEDKGVAIFLSPGDNFNNQKEDNDEEIKLKFLVKKLKPFKQQVLITFILLLLGSLFSLTMPFLTEALIDGGVRAKNIDLITMILLGQLGIFSGSIIINIFRNWLLLQIGSVLSINIISEFLKKLLRLPMSFFETKLLGDFSQRINDNERIEDFLTSQGIITFFSFITLSVFFVVLFYYDYKILLVYSTITIAAILWSFYWLKKRKTLDIHKFQLRSDAQESIFEILNGVEDLKLNQFDSYKTNVWQNLARQLFHVNKHSLKIDQIQYSGFEFINQVKNILTTYLAATYVVKGDMTLGSLLSISYIIGQMNSPISQLTDFFKSLQEAKLSLYRLNEVEHHPLEEQDHYKNLNSLLPNQNRNIKLNDVSFQYEGPNSPFVLKDVSFDIPDGKVTAIVGASGSGKTTLMKLLLRFYSITKGDILYDNDSISEVSPNSIRENSGVVMQNGYIFSDTIERNIATSDEEIDYKKLKKSARIANCYDFIKDLPLQHKTKIGESGMGLSGGQKQRILIARAVYKDPHYLFFDEATSALDAENEKIIHDNLQQFFIGRTVMIIAHRLSTVKNADQIIMLKNGQVVEKGTHEELVENRGDYFNLVKNQLELGN